MYVNLPVPDGSPVDAAVPVEYGAVPEGSPVGYGAVPEGSPVGYGAVPEGSKELDVEFP